MDPVPDLPFSAAAERNKTPILEVLASALPVRASVLELASGTGQHAAHFARQQPGWTWQPSDTDPLALATITARCSGLANVRPPMNLDLLGPGWSSGLADYDAWVCTNLLHISPWATCAALMLGAAAHMVPGGVLAVYGPFDVEGEPLAPSNRAFDADLRTRDSRWGLRRLVDVQREARAAGLVFERRVAMPANNLMLLWRKPAA